MLSLDDVRWRELDGGYKLRYNAASALARLYAGRGTPATFSELWENLHHQGDVGEASYAAVPHLVAAYRNRGVVDWNYYALVAVVELARTQNGNPIVPDWLAESYFEAIQQLAEIGASEVMAVADVELVRSILAVLAIAKGLRNYGRLLLNYSEDELSEMRALD